MFTNDLLQRLPLTLDVVEQGPAACTDFDLESLAELASIAFDQSRSEGYFGGTSGPLSVRTLHTQPELDPENDALVLSHVREIIRSDAAGRSRSLAGRSVVAGNVPYEDRGRTIRDARPMEQSAFMQSEGGPSPADGGPAAISSQWIPIGIWALKTIGKILKKRRENNGK